MGKLCVILGAGASSGLAGTSAASLSLLQNGGGSLLGSARQAGVPYDLERED